jgi:hypothetical protein
VSLYGIDDEFGRELTEAIETGLPPRARHPEALSGDGSNRRSV